MIIVTGTASIAAVAVALMSATPHQNDLNSPYRNVDALAGALVDTPGQCPPAPRAVRDIIATSKYGANRRETNSTVIDPEDAMAYAEATQPVLEFTRKVARLADSIPQQREGAGHDSRCAMAWMNAWAEDNAMLGKTGGTGEAVRKWELATLAGAYLKIRHAPHDAGQARRVRQWLRQLALAVRADYSHGVDRDSRANNHLNWAAWAVMAAAIATDDRDLFNWSIDRFRYALNQIEPDGTLPLELERRQLALAYHAFAAAPLILLREGAGSNGVTLSADEESRLQRLVDRVLTGLADPAYIATKAGSEQDLSKVSDAQLAWLEPYYARTGDRRALAVMANRRPLTSSRLGGDLTAMFATAQPLAPGQQPGED